MSNINVNYKNVFIHVPKCAGSSMERLYFVGGAAHMNLYHITRRPNFNKSFIRWAFIRNPYTRIASAYFAMSGVTETERIIKREHKTFKDFIMNIYKYLPKSIDYKVEYGGYQVYHILPLYYYLKDDKYEMNFIGRFENLQEDWKKLTKLIGVNSKLYHINKTTKKPTNYLSLYDNDMKSIIESVYKLDFEYYYKDWNF